MYCIILNMEKAMANPLQYSCLGNPMDRGAWWAAVHGVAKSRTRLSNLTFTFQFHALEKEMATHSSTLAWKIPWKEEPGRLQSMGSLRVGHDWVSSLSLFSFMHWRRKWQPTPVFLPGESQGRETWWAAVYGVAHSPTQLKRLSSSNSSIALKVLFRSLKLQSSISESIGFWK